MFSIGDRVYHYGAQGNGIVVAIHPTNYRSKFGVQFFWKKYKKCRLHTLDGFLEKPMGIWASADKLVKTPLPEERVNRFFLLGRKSLDKLINKMCEIPLRSPQTSANIYINYGTFRHVTNPVFVNFNSLVINKELMSNKYNQIKKMEHTGVGVPKTELSIFDNCIQKPYHSMGGKNIKEYEEGDYIYGYFQEKINKIREFRAHVFLWNDIKVPLIQEKFVENISQLTWNKKQGGEFKAQYQPALDVNKIDATLLHRIAALSVSATRTLHYDMGGVDIIMDSSDELYVIEINSRMGLREKSFATYKQVFWKLYNLNVDEYKLNRWEN